jgi:hypothetical protein
MTDILPSGCGPCDRITTNDDPARMFYYSMSDESIGGEIVPSPNISVSLENYYSNESIIGYTYNVTLTGYAASRQDREGSYGAHIRNVVGSIARLQDLFNRVGNGGKLIVYSPGSTTDILMEFTGSRIKNISFPPSENRWINYSEYTIELEFNEANFFGCNYTYVKNCNTTMFDGNATTGGGINTIQNKLVDFGSSSPTGYKIKSFNDSWNMSLQDEIYDWALVDGSLEVNNKRYNIEYSVSAVGQHYWDSSGNLFPAWKQAKAFCQDRLVKQINAVYNNMAMHYSGPEDSFCGSAEDLMEIHDTKSPTIHNTIGPMNIFDEKITFNLSEAEGSFNISYTAIVKKNKESCITSADTIHNLSITRSGSNTCGQNNTAKTVSLSGSIQGLLRDTSQGSIIWPNSEGFRIPDSPGQMIFLPPKLDIKYKWIKAKELLDRFIDECSGRIVCGPLCDIILKCMTPQENEDCQEICKPICEKPNSFSITHNYNTGTIDYNAEFNYDTNDNTNRRCNVTISTEEPVPLTAEFTIPGRGIYYQPLGGCTPKKWTINAEGTIDGYDTADCSDLGELMQVCSDLPTGCGNFILPGNGYLLLSKQKTFNPIDGSFSYNATYVCTICPGPNTECS